MDLRKTSRFVNTRGCSWVSLELYRNIIKHLIIKNVNLHPVSLEHWLKRVFHTLLMQVHAKLFKYVQLQALNVPHRATMNRIEL